MVDGKTDPASLAAREAAIREATVGEPERLSGPILLVEPDPRWSRLFAREAQRLRRALGSDALCIEHVGSTSVPGLAAKPVVDVLLVVADSADEPAYVPSLEAYGYVLHIREPGWHEHRMFNRPASATRINLHVFSNGCAEIGRMLGFRDRLRASPDDCDLYLRTKRELAGRTWTFTQDYADAKSVVVEEILARAAGA